LLALNPFRDIPIVAPAAFVQGVARSAVAIRRLAHVHYKIVERQHDGVALLMRFLGFACTW
jgi:hypothetical protein